MSAKARVICRSARIENRSVQLCEDFIDRLTRATMTCFSRDAVMAPMPSSCAPSSSTASRSFRPILSVGSNFSTTGSRNSRNKPTDCPKDALKKPQIWMISGCAAGMPMRNTPSRRVQQSRVMSVFGPPDPSTSIANGVFGGLMMSRWGSSGIDGPLPIEIRPLPLTV
jgi:hypothetical protein